MRLTNPTFVATTIRMAAVWIILTLVGFLAVPLQSHGQAPPTPGGASNLPAFETPPASPSNPAPRGTGNVAGPAKLLSNYEFVLSLVVLFFGVVVILAQYRLMASRSVAAEDIVRMFAVTLIIVGTLFAVTAGFSSEQIAPAMGLFGTIAGYLLGRAQRPGDEGARSERTVEPRPAADQASERQ